MLVHFAPAFERVDGVDIAPEMLAAAAAHARERHPRPRRRSRRAPFEDASFDFAFSLQVFQVLPRPRGGRHVHRRNRAGPQTGGRAVLQFDSRPQAAIRRLVLRLPDALLPRDHRRYIRRYPVPPPWPADRAAAGLALVDERTRLGAGRLHQAARQIAREVLGVQRGAADKRAVDVGLRRGARQRCPASSSRHRGCGRARPGRITIGQQRSG